MVHISLEGIDGSGKTTQANLIFERLNHENIDVTLYQYTSKLNKWGSIINKLDNSPYKMISGISKNAYSREFLYAMSARANYNNVRSLVNNTNMLLSDRSLITAYASHINELPLWFMNLLETEPVPNIAIYLDMPPSKAFERIRYRSPKHDETLDALNVFRDNYEKIMADKPNKLKNIQFLRVNADCNLETVSNQIYSIVRNTFMEKSYGT